MKNSLFLVGTAAVAAFAMACAGTDDEPTLLDSSGTGGGGTTTPGAGGGGTTTPGAGGGGTTTPGAGGGGTTTPGAGGGGTVGGVADFVTGGLGESGTWKGYLFTAASANGTIAPAEFLGSEICAAGTLPPTADFSEWGMVGWNIAQVIDEAFVGGDALEIAPGGTGISVTVTNAGATDLRVQIQDNSETAEKRWCANIPASGTADLVWADFNTTCWDGLGTTYDGVTPISQVAIQAPQMGNSIPTDFDFCVLHLGPIGG